MRQLREGCAATITDEAIYRLIVDLDVSVDFDVVVDFDGDGDVDHRL